MPLDQVRKRQRGLSGEAMANAVPLAVRFLSGSRANQPPDRVPVSCLRHAGRVRGTGLGPVAGMARFCARVRAGTRAQSISRGPFRPRPG
ncbi:hypothetical protein OEG84_07375 [Hoeflea sp. G2-23]|uniref:Uncharacterized protein n=1 Tax=Hoeflea algicola TaxID=2983763 RepID=A0ABT3Z6Y5_9HYPH|nr:hypothetical protein [Hoeflea algicola]MCY0147538.1 hypothetical protein [Hoeflea algicola]